MMYFNCMRTRMASMMQAAVVALLVGVSSFANASEPVLIPEGPVTLVRGTTLFDIDTAVKIEPGDIIATGAGASALIESGSDTLIALAANTQALISSTSETNSPDAAGPVASSVSLLTGWLKVSRSGSHAPLGVDTRALHIDVERGSVVIQADRAQAGLFVETGSATVSEPDGNAAPLVLTDDRFAQRVFPQAFKPLVRPDPAFVNALPVSFRDPLQPVPAARLPKVVPPANGRPVAYADVAPWLTSTLPVRQTFVARFRPLSHSDPFRSQIRQNLRVLPEWRPVIYPPPPHPRPSSAPRAVPEAL